MTLLLLSGAWLAGVVAAALGLAAWWPAAAVAGAAVSFASMLAGRARESLLLAAMLVGGLLGLLRYDLEAASRLTYLPGDDGKAVTLRGVVASEPEQRERSQRFRVDVSETDGSPARFGVLVTTRPFPRFEYGDRLTLTGELVAPPSLEGFDYRAYLERQGIVALLALPKVERAGPGAGARLTRDLIEARDILGEAIARAMPEPEAALARGILLGQRASIPPDVYADFNRSGTSHLIAISGYNVMLVAGLTASALAWALGRRNATLVAVLTVVAFALFVGGTGSVLRATAMALVMLGARLAGRPGSALTAVAFAAALLTAWQPAIIDDVGFQLSLAATLGIVLLERPLEEAISTLLRLAPGSPAAALAESAAVTLSASLAVLPITLASFGSLPLYSLPANLLAVPAYPLALAGSLVTSLAGLASNDLGGIVGSIAYLPLAYLIGVAHVFAGLPAASVTTGQIGLIGAFLLCMALGVIGLAQARRQPRPRQYRAGPSPAVLAAGVLALLAIFVWRDAVSRPDGRLSVSVLDVGQGDAILIQTPDGIRILVDGGPSGPGLLRALDDKLPAAARRIDVVVLTHGHDDHVTGLVELIERYSVGQALAGPAETDGAAFRAWKEALARRSVPLRLAVAGEWLSLGPETRLEVLGPVDLPASADLNDASVVLRLVHGRVSFLLTGDIAAAGEAALLDAAGDLRATVLKVAHHGSDGSSTPAFLDAAAPRLAVISAGADNAYGHPSPTTLLRLAGVPLLSTAVNGHVQLFSDGRSVWAGLERGGYRVVSPSAAD